MEINKTIWNGLEAVQVDHQGCTMVIVVEFGPRISFWGKSGRENLLFWDTKGRGRKEWRLRGGHRVWIMTQGADESEMTYSPDNAPCTIEKNEDKLTIWGTLDKANMTRRGIRIEEDERCDLKVTSLIENAGDMLLSCGVWVLTCTQPTEGTTYEFPLGDDSIWDTFKSIQFRKWGPCDGNFGDKQFQVTQDKFIVSPEGVQAKQMFNIPKGQGVMRNKERPNFRKEVDFNRHMPYPEGCNWAIYIGPDNFMVEYETMGPIITLKSNEILEHTEYWSLDED